MAKNVVRDFGSSAASKNGVQQLSKCSERSAERDTHNLLVKRYKLSLPVAITKLGSQPPLEHAVLRLRDWIEYIVAKNHWHIVAGLVGVDRPREEAILSKFWELFKVSNSEHPIFKMADQGRLELSRTAPLVWHGDEGRGRRRTPFLVTSFHSLLGRGVRAGLALQKKAGIKKSYVKLKPNFIGHTYTSRFLHCALPKAVYEDEAVFQRVLEHCVEEATYMREVGVTHPYTKQRYWAAVLHVVGDWQFLYKAGNMTRSYNNVAKHVQEASAPAGICHLCRAGQKSFEFEHIHLRTPSWLQTFCLDAPFHQPSPLLQLPHVPGEQPRLFQFDFFHSWHLGVGKSFVGSCLALLSEGCPGSSKDARFRSLNEQFMSFCRRTKETPILTKLSKESISWETNNSYPVGAWYKAGVTTVLCKFVGSKLRELAADQHEMLDEMLLLAKEGMEAIDLCITGLYESDAFLSPEVAKNLGEQGLRFLRRYNSLARLSVDRGRTLFALQPKHHALHHLFLQDLLIAGEKFSSIVNPIVFSVQLSEDFIGQNSRTSRRVHPNQCAQRCIERHLQLAYKQYVRAGYLVG